MTDQALDILKLALLLLLYLFFAWVLWTVRSEVGRHAERRQATDAGGNVVVGQHRETAHADDRRPPRSRGGRRPARLVVLEPKERKGTAFGIADGLGIGREPDNTVVISGDAFVSGHHAKVIVRDGRVVIDDLGSRNGTVVNGARLTRSHELRIGDRVQIGYTVLEAR